MDEWCATTSQEREETLAATASRVQRWLLVEHTGAWGPETVPSSRMPVETARSLARAATEAGARLLLIRRHHGEATAGARQVYAVDSRPGFEQVLGTALAEPDLAALTARQVGRGDGWQRVEGPLLLVCTHGRHDRCCAVRGRPVAHALWRRWPDTTWECSHVGGDRFAANLLVLPDGLYLGRVPEAEAAALVDALLAGQLPAGCVRGRSSLPLPAQAAQQFARERLARWGRADLELLEQEPAGPDRWRVRLGGPVPVEVVVRYDRQGDGGPHVLTCGAPEPRTAAVFRLVGLELLAPA